VGRAAARTAENEADGVLGGQLGGQLSGFLPSILRLAQRLRLVPARIVIGNALGRTGEACAARYLAKRDYRIIACNAVTKAGEADVIALAPDRHTVVLVEVKTRVRGGPDSADIAPELSVTAKKRRTLIRIAHYLRRVNRWTDRTIRIDVIAIEFESATDRAPMQIRHHESAVARIDPDPDA